MALNGMQQRFHALGAERAAIKATSGPAVAVREAVRARINVLDRIERKLTDQIKAIEAPVFNIDNERGALVRALKGKTGESVTIEAQPPMTAEQIKELVSSLNIDAVAVVQVEGQATKPAAPDPRIEQVMAVLGELAAKIEALPKPGADQSEAVATLYADMKNFAEAVQIHDASIKEIRQDIGIFYTRIKERDA